MFVCSMKKKQLFLCMIGFVLFAVGVAWLVGAVCKAARPQPQPMTEAAMAAYIESFGWEVETIPEEQKEVQIPTEWNEVYEQYNAIQLRQGFDLSDDLGKTVQVTTFVVTNYPDEPDYVRAHVLVYDDEIIAADIASIELDGFMHGLNENAPGSPDASGGETSGTGEETSV